MRLDFYFSVNYNWTGIWANKKCVEGKQKGMTVYTVILLMVIFVKLLAIFGITFDDSAIPAGPIAAKGPLNFS